MLIFVLIVVRLTSSPPEQYCNMVHKSMKEQLGAPYMHLQLSDDETDLDECLDTCLAHHACKAFNYDKSNRSCELFGQSELAYDAVCCDHYTKLCFTRHTGSDTARGMLLTFSINARHGIVPTEHAVDNGGRGCYLMMAPSYHAHILRLSDDGTIISCTHITPI